MKPMLSATCESQNVDTLTYPLMASPKYDGVRALVHNGVLVTRSLKPIPNSALQKAYKDRSYLEGLDGELIMGSPTAPDAFRKTASAVMSHSGDPKVTFWVFDLWDQELPYKDRYKALLQDYKETPKGLDIRVVEQAIMRTSQEVRIYEEYALLEGYEGIMLRSIDGLYKFGRSTMKEGGLMKLKQFSDAEAVIIGFEEQLHNTNEQTRDNLGNAERSSHKAWMVGKDTLGVLQVRGLNGPYKDIEFGVGTGFDDAFRETIWRAQSKFMGKTIKYKYFPSGSKDAPRFPVFLGFRED